jgi:hypothetical protein
VNVAGGFRDSKYWILLKVTKPAFALSSLPLAFCFVHAKKKTDNTTIKSNLRACKRQLLSLIQPFFSVAPEKKS